MTVESPHPSDTIDLFLDLSRLMTRAAHARGLHPAQMDALRHFAEAPSAARTVTGYGRTHRTTLGTASATIATLVRKGYLRKAAFRAPVTLTEAGEEALHQDPARDLEAALARCTAEDRAAAARVLGTLATALAPGAVDPARAA